MYKRAASTGIFTAVSRPPYPTTRLGKMTTAWNMLLIDLLRSLIFGNDGWFSSHAPDHFLRGRLAALKTWRGHTANAERRLLSMISASKPHESLEHYALLIGS
jgi:hypothetical protein